MERQWLMMGACFALVAVAAGAFGAHALREALAPERLANWNTAAQYAMYHALALLVVGLLTAVRGDSGAGGVLAVAGWSFTAGILLFSGSLWLLALTDVRWLGAITPLGGIGFLAGWGLLAYAALQR